ncbi:hypothetical protein ULMA_02370 [Patiriisocius marinus]|uniref:Uncharacterized protein n=1 Tax=Patiriisocius marinus TaxID=1397112 RepID=A0A5J4ILZ0_9FLAO|nr:hypothetical protein [Patiriisocius marinus]GER58129.1 hypothetical protein ULMA_02370 [Patiriisocius marinus]
MDTFNPLKIDRFTTDFFQRVDLSDYVIFIDNGNQEDVVSYIKSNYNAIQETFKTEGKRFLLLSEITNISSILKPLRYHYPRLTLDDVWRNLDFKTLKNYLGYKGNITTGLLSIDANCEFIQFESTSIASFRKLIDGYLNDYKQKRLSIEDCDELPFYFGESDSDDNIKLDDETKKTVDAILEQFETLKNKGNLLQILPIVEGYLKTQHTAHLDKLSTLKIDKNFTIFLRDYNLEIKLSHLTKSIYLLFLNHPEGILLTELNSHKKELLEYYKSISNRLDFDKINESIDDIINTSSNAIYVHLSRIKSAFTKVMHHSIAQYYFIDGGKNKPKKIDLRSDLIIWKNSIGNTSEISERKIGFSGMDAVLNMDADE